MIDARIFPGDAVLERRKEAKMRGHNAMRNARNAMRGLSTSALSVLPGAQVSCPSPRQSIPDDPWLGLGDEALTA